MDPFTGSSISATSSSVECLAGIAGTTTRASPFSTVTASTGSNHPRLPRSHGHRVPRIQVQTLGEPELTELADRMIGGEDRDGTVEISGRDVVEVIAVIVREHDQIQRW